MKQFRKWWENHRASAGPHTCQSSRGENLAQLADEEIWRAALEWSLKQELIDDDGRFINSYVIREELGDT